MIDSKKTMREYIKADQISLGGGVKLTSWFKKYVCAFYMEI